MGPAHHDDSDETELDPREWPDDSDVDDSEEEDTLPCPFCKKPIYEKADICPHCRNFVQFDERSRRHPVWVIAVALILLAMALAIVGTLLQVF